MSWTTWMLILVPIAIGMGQLMFRATSQTTGVLSVISIGSLFLNPWFLSAVLLYGVATVAWIFVLQSVPIGRAYQFMSLSFVVVPVGAWWIFGESMDVRQAVGVAVIVGGIAIGNS